MRRAGRGAPLLAALLVLALLVPPTTAARAERREHSVEPSDGLVSVQLPLTSAAGVLGGDDEIYVTGDDGLLVYDLDGELLDSVEDLPGAGPMALDPDGEILFVGLRSTGEVVALDLDDLEELASWDVPGRPFTMLADDHFVHVGTGKTNPQELVSIPLEGVPVSRSVNGTPLLASDGRGLLLGLANNSSGTVQRRAADGAPLAPPVERRLHGSFWDVDPEVVDLLWVAGSAFQETGSAALALDPSTLATRAVIRPGTHARAVRELRDRAHVAVAHDSRQGRNLGIWAVDGATSRVTAEHLLPGSPVHGGLSTTARPGQAWLTVIEDPDLIVADLEFDDIPAVIDEPVEVPARLVEPDGTPIAGVDLAIDGPAGRSTATTDWQGRTVLRHPPRPSAGTLELAVTFAGTPIHRAVEFAVEFDVALAHRPPRR